MLLQPREMRVCFLTRVAVHHHEYFTASLMDCLLLPVWANELVLRPCVLIDEPVQKFAAQYVPDSSGRLSEVSLMPCTPPTLVAYQTGKFKNLRARHAVFQNNYENLAIRNHIFGF